MQILRIIFLLQLSMIMSNSYGQMNFNGKPMYGHEWIQKNQSYYKFYLAEDGIFQLDFSTLENAGIALDKIRGNQLRIYKNGVEIPIFVSNPDYWSSGDFIQFEGFRNRAELDAALFAEGVPIFNKEYSFFSDSSAYFLTWNEDISNTRIQEISNDLSNPLPKDLFYIKKVNQVFSEASIKRSFGYQKSQRLPDFDEGQGYGTNTFVTREFSLNFKDAYPFGDPANIKISLVGLGEEFSAHRAKFSIEGEVEDFISFSGFKVREAQLNLDAEDLKENMVLKVEADGNPEDLLSISNIVHSYPARFQFHQSVFARINISASPIPKFLEIEDFNSGNTLWVYDYSNKFLLKSVKESNGIYRINLPKSTNERELILINPLEVKKINHMQRVEFIDIAPANYDYLIISSEQLINGSLGDGAVQEYESYRKSSEGGSFQPLIVPVEKIYDHFGFGVQSHSIAIRNFLQFTRNIWPNIKHVLIIGKGLEYRVYRKSGLDQNNFVPTYGTPAADYMLVSDSSRVPFYALGRIPVIRGEELIDYLNKVKEHESYLSQVPHGIADKEWIKKMVHLSGGDPELFQTISSQLNSMEQVIESTPFAAQVETFYKQSSNPIEVSNSDRLKYLIDNGVSVISFMGHSLSTRLDFNLENISSYQNKAKYHLFLAMGCYAGQMFENVRSISETHNLAPDKGSVVYLSNSTAGFPYILGEYGSEFYRQFGDVLYGKSIGEAVRAANSKMVNDFISTGNESILHQALSISYNGDPAIRFLTSDSPDFIPDVSSIKTNPGIIFLENKQFTFELDLLNIGKFGGDSLNVLIENESFMGKREKVFEGKVKAPVLRDRYAFNIPINQSVSVGFNTLYMQLDPDNDIMEAPLPFAEENNLLVNSNGEMGFKYYVLANQVTPIYPLEFSIIDSSRVNLIASTGQMISGTRKFFFEIDTTEYFTSALLKTEVVNSVGGNVFWNPDIQLMENTVYYWRVSPDSNGTGVLGWKNSSFIYLNQSPDGWNQSHFFQDRRNTFNQIQLEEPDRKFEFKEGLEDFRVFNAITRANHFLRPKIFYKGDVKVDYNDDIYKNDFSAVLISVFDPVSGDLWLNSSGSDYGSFYQSNYSGKPFFIFPTDNLDARTKLIDFLENILPVNAVVCFMTLVQGDRSFYGNQWELDGSKNLISTLKKFGSVEADKLKSDVALPYIFIFRKGRMDYNIREKFGTPLTEIDLAHFIPIKFNSGDINSALIGPASQFYRCVWDVKSENQDEFYLNIYGLKSDGSETALFQNVVSNETDLSTVSSNEFDRLRLEWKSSDQTYKTSAQKNFWRVLYKGLPDVSFDQSRYYYKSSDTLNQGENFRIDIAAINMSKYSLDSLLVKISVISPSNQEEVIYTRLAPLKGGSHLIIPFAKNTSRQLGLYKVLIELNPEQDQKESNYSNNIAILQYFVKRDFRKPRILLTFDGQVIQEGDLVSPQTKIEISLRDENKAFLLDDTSLISIKLRYPDRTIRNVYFNQPAMEFIGASNPEHNEAKAILRNDFIQDGVYEILIRAKDQNGNFSIETEHRTSFQIKSKAGLSNFLNYPNPFTQKTRFVYTLSGSQIPKHYKIQILTISGKIVKEINQEELGPLLIGTHMTEYEYDGTDQFGQKLANGVYLYRFTYSSEQEQQFEKIQNELTDKYFSKGFGKMVLLR